MKKNYRITFYDGPEGNRSKNVDIYAESFDDARRQAWQMDEAKYRMYSDMMIEKIPVGPSVIGIRYEYIDPCLSGRSTQCLFIKATDEAEAISYYNKHYKNTRFDFPDYRKNNDNGRCIRDRIVETYFAPGVVNFEADATIKTEKAVIEIIADAQNRVEEAPKGNIEKELDI